MGHGDQGGMKGVEMGEAARKESRTLISHACTPFFLIFVTQKFISTPKCIRSDLILIQIKFKLIRTDPYLD